MSAERTYRIGRYELILPADHLLDQYQSQFRLYDRVLGDIAQIVWQKYPGATSIDIGANIGDSAALICREQDFPVLCIEGSPRYVEILRRNLARLPPVIEVAPYLVGATAALVPAGSLKEDKGTASLNAAAGAAGGFIAVRPLADILSDYPRFAAPRLIKSDTDGADFETLASSCGILQQHRPVLFFEYDPTFRRDGFEAGLQAIALLEQAGYRYFLVYDNYGNLMDFVTADVHARFAQFNRYLMSHALFGRRIYYLDICACGKDDEDIAALLRDRQAQALDGAISRWRSGEP